jgi:hypothetical protein
MHPDTHPAEHFQFILLAECYKTFYNSAEIYAIMLALHAATFRITYVGTALL